MAFWYFPIGKLRGFASLVTMTGLAPASLYQLSLGTPGYLTRTDARQEDKNGETFALYSFYQGIIYERRYNICTELRIRFDDSTKKAEVEGNTTFNDYDDLTGAG